jgi:hypothetical protein
MRPGFPVRVIVNRDLMLYPYAGRGANDGQTQARRNRRPETGQAHNRTACGDTETALLTLKSWRAKQRKGRLSALN